ncbi:hypothetical protein AQPW35_16730 [Rubrivivax pictus]|uniref:Secreted protein n=1 Tax=Pseudaquabacterium pictum TaxID=2315236 RepID=A0A480ARD4_9BURK|nr:hypothetical protein AQPW35_16730 [Rubrivivax pictus]
MNEQQDTKMKKTRTLALATLALVPNLTVAGILDDLPDLQGKTIVYAGNFDQVPCPIGGKYDCLSWPMDLLKTTRGREICLKPTSYTSCSYSCKGLIAVGDDKIPYLYLLDRIGNDIKKSGFEVYKCLSLY